MPRQTRRIQRKKKIPEARQGKQWPRGSIVYICGVGPVKFGPEDKDLGGSEQAVVQLSKCWAASGHPVVVFGNVKECSKDGVEYRSINDLDLSDTFDYAIFWRSMGIRLLPLIKARCRIVDLHDSWDPKQYVSPTHMIKLVDFFMVKSEYHKSLYKYIPESKLRVVMNGVQVDLFQSIVKNIPEASRNPYRLIYASSYDRGLLPILQYTWPIIKRAIPEATFDIYYGMNKLAKTHMGVKLKALFHLPGVKEHGRIDLEQIAKEKATSAIHLYVSNCSSEIDCISVRESLLCGSVPILGNDYVFKERDGIHITGSTHDPATYKKAALTIIHYLKHQGLLEKKRKELYKSDTIISWDSVAQKWLDYMKRV